MICGRVIILARSYGPLGYCLGSHDFTQCAILWMLTALVNIVLESRESSTEPNSTLNHILPLQHITRLCVYIILIFWYFDLLIHCFTWHLHFDHNCYGYAIYQSTNSITHTHTHTHTHTYIHTFTHHLESNSLCLFRRMRACLCT